MRLALVTHLSEETIENHVLGHLAEGRKGDVKRHLRVCPDCQRVLEEVKVFIAATKIAAAELAGEAAAKPARIPMPGVVPKHLWAAAAFTLLLGFFAWKVESRPVEERTVRLEALRGIEVGANRAPADHFLRLDMDARDLPAAARFRLEVVSAAGIRQWSGQGLAKGGRVSALVDRTLKKGGYWIRLYSPASQLLREYGLSVE